MREVRKIWKYPIEIDNQTILELPQNAKFLSVASQEDKPVLYFVVNPKEQEDNRLTRRVVLLFGTNQPINPIDLWGATFLGTAPTHNGRLVWHLFMREARPNEY